MSLFVSVTPLLLGSNSTVITALNGIDGFIFNYDPLLQTRHCVLKLIFYWSDSENQSLTGGSEGLELSCEH